MIKDSIRTKIVEEYLDKKISYYELERKYGVNRNTIASWVKNNGVETKYFKSLPENEVVDLYANQKKSVNDIALIFKVSVSPVRRVLKKKGISIRDNSERHIGQPAWNKGKTWNEDMKERLSKLASKRDWIKEKNPNWKGGITPKMDKRRNWRIVKLWRTACLERDNHSCLECGSKERIEVNHIIPIRQIKDLVLLADVENGITLCRNCHKKTYQREHKYADFFKKLLKNRVNSGKTLIFD